MLLLQEVVGVSPGGEGSWAETHDILAVTVKVSFISKLGLFCLDTRSLLPLGKR